MRAMNLPEPVHREEEGRRDRLHDTRYLLQQYRRVEYSVRLSCQELQDRAMEEYGTELSTLKNNAELAGMDLSGTKIESYTRSVVRSLEMLRIIDRALRAVKEDPICGERMYYTLYYTFTCPKRYPRRELILEKMDELGYPMSLGTYHNYLNKGIEALDKILWGYTSAECREIIDSFLEKDE